MPISKVKSASITTDAVGPTQLNEASNYSFTGNVTGAGESNTPNFYAYGVDQAVSDATSTKLQFSNEVVDSDNAYDPSTYRFTVPSGKAGLYFFNSTFRFYGGTLSQINFNYKKNGSQITSSFTYSGGTGTPIYNSMQYVARNQTILQNLNVGDYIEVFAFFDITGGSTLQAQTQQNIGEFSGFRITS